MIHNNSAESEIQDYAFKNNESIDQASTNLILSGITSCDEILRINNLKDNGSV
jgi:general secretion pathway protein E